MAELIYQNFDLLIEGGSGAYRVRLIDSPAGQAQAEFTSPFSELELENFYLRIGRPRQSARRLESPQMAAAKKMGERLFAAVFSGEVYACFLSSLNEMRRQQKGLRIRLRIASAELGELPWEFLYNPASNQFLSWSIYTPLVRFLDAPSPPQPLLVQPPLRLLVMISSPRDAPPLDVQGEWLRLQDALAPLVERGVLQIARLERATLAELQRSLRRHETHIFHFIGHGKYEASANDGLLLLEREDGSSHVLSGQYLGPVLNNHAALRLVVLNACEGARTGASDPYAGAAQSLVQQGIPAVVAMQFEISDQAAITFAGEFYGALADGLPVDAALVQARTAIFAQGNDIEWGTPVYFTRSPDGRIFDLPAAAPEPASPIAGPVAPPEPEQAPSRPAKAARRAFFARLSSQGWAILVGALVMTVIGILVASGLVIQNYQSMASDNATATVQALEVQLSSRATATQLARQSLQLTASAGKPATAQPAASPQPGSDLPPQTAAPGETWRAPADGMALVYIPAGAFWMGSAQDSAISEPDEQPQHKVTLSAFWIDRSEVTNAMYALCVQAKACTPPGETGSFGLDSYYDGAGYGDYPVIHVSWYQASQYCAWAGRRLPSEAEWEKAARGGLEQALYPWGDQQPDCSRANFDNNGVVCNNDPVQVGSYPPNGYGLFDMAGNVWEWVNDWYGPYTAAEANDPDGAPQGEQRLLRGGAWNVLGQDLRVAVRLGFEPVNTSMVAGFRCALPAAGQAGQ